jgi:hypothetical protein
MVVGAVTKSRGGERRVPVPPAAFRTLAGRRQDRLDTPADASGAFIFRTETRAVATDLYV